MYFSKKIIHFAFDNLINIDASDGKSRKEKVSGLRHCLAASEMIRANGGDSINLRVGSDQRKDFVDSVGKIVSLNSQGLYTKDFHSEFATNSDFAVGSNFLTTALQKSRYQDRSYPGRPAALLRLNQEEVSILDTAQARIIEQYGVSNVKAALCVWLLRDEEFDLRQGQEIESAELARILSDRLRLRFTQDIADAMLPNEQEISLFIDEFDAEVFSTEVSDYSDIAFKEQNMASSEEVGESSVNVLNDDLPDDDDIYQAVQKLLDRGSTGILFSGPPGTSKTWYAIKVASKILGGDFSRLERVQFHPSFTYEDFIEGLVSTGSLQGDSPLFEPKEKVFLKLCNSARSDLDNLYILIIDEFSRGDPSKIFGELLTYIEPDYRDVPFQLPYSEREISIPQNIVVFATMNPFDKSVADIDAAMERRFDVVELLPSVEILKKLLDKNGISGELKGKIIEFFNTANRLTEHRFGHAFLNGVSSEEDLLLLWNHKLKFIFEKMFKFEQDIYSQIKEVYEQLVDDESKALIR